MPVSAMDTGFFLPMQSSCLWYNFCWAQCKNIYTIMMIYNNYLICLGLCLHAAVSLADADLRQDMQRLLALDLADLLEVKVTIASKNENTIAAAPSSVTVFTRKEIINLGISNLGELLKFVPGFQSFRLALNGDSQGFQVRGNPVLPVFTRDVLILLNGQRLNDSHTGGAVLYNSYLNLENVEQIEIIRGPGSALYGSNAFLGVINIITNEKLNEINLSTGTQAQNSIAVHLSKDLAEDIDISTFFRLYADQGDNYTGLTDRFGHQGEVKDKKQAADLNITANLANFKLQLRHIHRRSFGFLDSEYIGSREHNNSEQEQSSIGLSYKQEFFDNLDVKLSGNYTRSRLYFLSNTNKIVNNYPELFGLYLENDSFNFDMNANWQLSAREQWQIGVNYENTGNNDNALIENTANNKLNYLRGADSFTQNQRRDIFGLYAQYQRSITDELNAVIGLRYDKYSDFGNTINPRAALIYTTNWGDQIKLLYGQAFRAPNLADLTLNIANSKGNPNLKPESVATTELAYIRNFTQGQIIATIFQNNISDVIAIEADATGQFFAHNKGELKRTGLELEIYTELQANWLLRLAYTRMQQAAQGHAAREFGSIISNYNLGKFNFNLSSTYRGKIPSLDKPERLWLINTALRYQFTPDISLQANIINLTDKIYYDPAEFSNPDADGHLRSMQPGIPNRGREAWLEFRLQF